MQAPVDSRWPKITKAEMQNFYARMQSVPVDNALELKEIGTRIRIKTVGWSRPPVTEWLPHGLHKLVEGSLISFHVNFEVITDFETKSKIYEGLMEDLIRDRAKFPYGSPVDFNDHPFFVDTIGPLCFEEGVPFELRIATHFTVQD